MSATQALHVVAPHIAVESCHRSGKSLLPPFQAFLCKPLRTPALASSSLAIRKAAVPSRPLVARTSDWAQAEGESEREELHGKGRGRYPGSPEDAKLFVGNLPHDMDNESLAKLFDQAGTVVIAEVMYDLQTDRSRGFGYVTMSTVEEAHKALEMLHRYDCNGKLLTVDIAGSRGSRPARPRIERGPFINIYVGNLPWQLDDARLLQVFSEYGKVSAARVVYDRETGRSRGFGFVTMLNKLEADDAIAALNGQMVDGRTLKVTMGDRPRRDYY